MTWREILLVLIRCELKVKYSYLGGWQLSAKGALPIIVLSIVVMAIWLLG